jgi:6-phosphogluconolactonase
MLKPVATLWLLLASVTAPAWGADWIVYVGAYTGPNNKGIHAYRFSDSTGKLADLGLAAESSNPSFLAVSPNRRFLYAANENADGAVSAFSIGSNGALKPLNSVSSKGAGPCHVAVDHAGKWLFATNYNSGSVAAFPIHGDGSLGEASAFVQHTGSSVNPQRQTGPHAHSANLSPDNRLVLVTDLGLDQILSYKLDLTQPAVTKVAPGAGPRHLVFSPNGRFAYAVNELFSTVSAFQYNAADGSLKELQTVPALTGPTTISTAAEIAILPNGKFVYASNRGDNSIAIFRIDPATGMLAEAGRVPTLGRTPRNFAIDPAGKFLLAANQDSGNIIVFRIDAAGGGLKPTGETVNLPSPVSLVFVPFK